MTVEFVGKNWAALAGGAIGVAVALFAGYRAWVDSARGRLRGQIRRLKRRYRGLVAAQHSLDRARTQLQKLKARAASVKPSRVQAAEDAVEDAAMLLKVAQDQVLIAENHVRKLILEEFPPRHHEALRKKLLRRPERDGKPFTF